MKLSTIVIVSLFLSGCTEDIKFSGIEKGIKRCRNNGGVKHFSEFMNVSVTCNNSAVFTWYSAIYITVPTTK